MFVDFSKVFGGEKLRTQFCLCVQLLKKRVSIKNISVILVFVRMLIRKYGPHKYAVMMALVH